MLVIFRNSAFSTWSNTLQISCINLNHLQLIYKTSKYLIFFYTNIYILTLHKNFSFVQDTEILVFSKIIIFNKISSHEELTKQIESKSKKNCFILGFFFVRYLLKSGIFQKRNKNKISLLFSHRKLQNSSCISKLVTMSVQVRGE